MARTRESIARRRQMALPAAHRYAERELRPRLGWGAAPAELSIPGEGLRSLVYFAAPREGMASVIHAFTDGRERSKLRRALALNAAGDLPIPKLLHSGWGWAERLGYGFSFVAAEMAPGKLVSELPYSDEMMRAVGRALAQLHAKTSTGWGPPPGRKRSSLAHHLKTSYEEKLAELNGVCSKIDSDLLDRAAAQIGSEWMRMADAEERSKRAPPAFCLCHHHLAPDDVLYDAASGRTTIIDCASLVHSAPARDLAMARHTIAGDDEGRWRLLLEGYAERSGDEAMRGRLRWMKFFTLFVLLSKWRNHASDPERRAATEAALRKALEMPAEPLPLG